MNKKLSCFLCWLPLVLMILVLGPLVFISVGLDMGVISKDVALPFLMLLVFGSILLVVLVWGVMIWLIVKTVKNKTMDVAIKVVWIFVLYVFNVLAYPVYWFIFIKKE